RERAGRESTALRRVGKKTTRRGAHLRAGRGPERARLALLQLLRLLAHLLAEIGAELGARLGGEGEPDAGADQAAERKDADAAERGRPGATALLEADGLEDVVAVDVLQVLEGLQAALLDVIDVHVASAFAASKAANKCRHLALTPICALSRSDAR